MMLRAALADAVEIGELRRSPAARVGTIARRADDVSSDPAGVPIEDPIESFDVWLRELLAEPPTDLDVTGAELVAQARADDA